MADHLKFSGIRNKQAFHETNGLLDGFIEFKFISNRYLYH
jgi:hypothetical protein